MEQLGERVKLLRLEKGWTRRCLAKRALLHEFHLSKIERGERQGVTAETLCKLSEAFEVSADYFLGRIDEPRHVATKKVAPYPPY